MITLYELAGADTERRFSPFCWRIRMALLHKGLKYDGVPGRFTDKQAIAFSGGDKYPVLSDGDHAVHDSPAIAAYLEQAYPDRPLKLEGATRFVVDWTELVLQPALFRLVVIDIPKHLAPQDVDYFVRTREARVGMKLEDYCADRDKKLAELKTVLTPLRRTLGAQPFLDGDAPAWADYVVFGAFQWARCVSPLKLLETDDPIYQWRERMLDLYDGEARRAVGYAV
jgi:glutathione S-transferase